MSEPVSDGPRSKSFLVAVLLILCCGLAGSTVFSYRQYRAEIEKGRRDLASLKLLAAQAEEHRKRAQVAELIAEEKRREAEDFRAILDAKREETEEARDLADRFRKEAVVSQKAAEHSRKMAEAAAEGANRQRMIAGREQMRAAETTRGALQQVAALKARLKACGCAEK
jgi:hypothetical protein